MILRALLAALLLAGVIGLAGALVRKRRHQHVDLRDLPPLPAEIGGRGPTWVVFTTEYCTTCAPVKARITRIDPAAELVEIDVADEPVLARRYRVKTAPTVLYAGPDRRIRARLAGNVPESDLAEARAAFR